MDDEFDEFGETENVDAFNEFEETQPLL